MTKQASIQSKNKTLKDYIDYYEICNRSEGKSPKTISWYSANLRCFCQYLKRRKLSESIDTIDLELLREYVIHLLNISRFEDHAYVTDTGPLAPATVHGHVRTLRAFFSWLAREGLIGENKAVGLKPPKVPRKIISTLSDEEIAAIFRTFNMKESCDMRNQAILMVLIDTGLRIGELIGLKMDNCHLNEGILKVMGKGQKERIVPIGNNAQRALQKYLFRYRPEPAYMGIENVFLSVQGKALTENSMKLMFARLAKRSGVRRLHAHLCRHTFATRFLANGGDVFTLQQMLGHSTLEMVRQYANVASSHVVMQHQKFSPLDRLNLSKV